jgi:ribosome recycling factor
VNTAGKFTQIINVTDATQLLVKPFDPSSKHEIVRAIESAGLGLNPQVEGSAIRINVPPPSADRRKQLINQVKKMAEEAKVAVRNERRDANKHIDLLKDDKKNPISDDQADRSKEEIDDLTKKFTTSIEETATRKIGEIEQI